MHDIEGDRINNPSRFWMALLAISTRYICEKIRSRATRELDNHVHSIEAIELALFSIKYDIPRWHTSALERLVTREELLKEEEAAKLPFSIAIMLTRSRERYQMSRMGYNYNSGYGRNHGSNSSTIDPRAKVIVEEELKIMHNHASSQ